MKIKRSRKAFTIVELVIVIAVIAILATVLVPAFGNVIQNAKDSAAKQEAKNAYTEYMVENAGKGEMPVLFLYKAEEGRIVAIQNGAAVGVYESEDAALTALIGEDYDKDELKPTTDGKLFAYGGEVPEPVEPSEPEKTDYFVQLDKNVLTLTSDKGLNEVLTLPDPNVKFTHADMKNGVVVKAGVDAPAEGFHVQFKTADINKPLYITAKNIPEGYTFKYTGYAFYADGSNSKTSGGAWTIYTDESKKLLYNPNATILAFNDYAISYAFYSNETGEPVDAPEGDWEVLIHYGKTYTPAEYTYKIVDINGTGDYTSVVEAVEKEPENTVLVILPGTYVGTVEAFTKSIILVGVDRETCIMKSYDGRYEYPVINGSCGFFANLTMHSEYVEGVSHEVDKAAYAFHCENEYGVGKTLEFHNCTLISDFLPALGMGMRKEFTCIIDNCELISNQPADRGSYAANGSLGALYFHDSTGEKGNSYLIVKDSILTSELKNVMCPYTLIGKYDKADQNRVYCTFKNNIIEGEIWDRNGNAFEKNFVLTEESSGNTIGRLNYN